MGTVVKWKWHFSLIKAISCRVNKVLLANLNSIWLVITAKSWENWTLHSSISWWEWGRERGREEGRGRLEHRGNLTNKYQNLCFSWQDSKRVSTLGTIHKRRPPGPTVMFFAGGYLRRSLDVLECFDPLTLKWTILSPLSVPKSGLGAAYVGKL